MNLLYETNSLRLENEGETAFWVSKPFGKVLLEDYFYGDPTCGLIDSDNQWAIVAGEHLAIWTPQKWQRIDDEGLRWIHALRVKNHNTVEILIDPWSERSAIWEIDVQTFEFRKVMDFDTYKDKEYKNIVEW